MNRCLLDNFCYDLELQVDISISDLTNYIYEFYEIWTTICKITTLIFDCEKCNYAIMKKKFDSLNQNIMWNDRNVPEHILIYKRILAAHIDTMYNLPSDLQFMTVKVSLKNAEFEIFINYKNLNCSLEEYDIEKLIKYLATCSDLDKYLNLHLINTKSEEEMNTINHYNNRFMIIINLRYVIIQNNNGSVITFSIDKNIIETVHNYVDKYYSNYIRSFAMKFED